jgi:aminoglycoside phosphotransferase (APT) family kinase protein
VEHGLPRQIGQVTVAPPKDARVGDDNVAERLHAFVRAQLPGVSDLRIDAVRRTSSGFSRENWVFDASWSDADGHVSEKLIMRRDPAGSLLETDRRVEFAVLDALAHTSVPAPRVRWLDADGSWLGRPSVVMVREEGTCDWFVLNGDRPLEERIGLAHAFCDLLADVHHIDWRALELDRVLPDPGPRASLVALEEWVDVLRRQQLEAHPELEVVAAWLRQHAPTAQATVLVHGDWKPGNALLVADNIGAMLDWETAHLGDPLEDLGWITQPARAREHQIPGVWEREQIFERYRARSGFSVDATELHWWNVFACFKASIINLTGLRAFVDGRIDRVWQVPVGMFRVMFDLIDA